MKIDKILKKAAKKQEEEILAKDKDFYNAIIKEHFDEASIKMETPKKQILFKKKNFWMSFCSAFILIVCLSSFLGIWLDKDGEQTKRYSKENCQGIVSTIEELNNDLQFSKIKLSENYEVAVILNYDTVSGDHLYYNLTISSIEDIEHVDLMIYINRDYEYNIEINDKAQDLVVNEFKIKYLYSFQVDSDNLYAHNVTANLLTNFEAYRIDYIQMNFEETYGFETFVKNCILHK